eukprot:541083-Alexandrium_andersonii.AAC.1
MVVETRAAWMHVPRSAPRPGKGQICVRPLRVACLDSAQQRVSVFLESRSGAAVETGVLSVGLLSIPDLLTMRAWTPGEDLQYGFGVPVPAPLQAATADVFAQLCARSPDGYQCAVVLDNADVDFTKRGLLQWMESHGFATEVQQDAASSSWQLTDQGAAALEL